MKKFQRITVDPKLFCGKPCIRGLRFPVSRLLGLLASGETRESILKAYPYLEPEDITEALRYAASLAEEETIEFSDPFGAAPAGHPEMAQIQKDRVRRSRLPLE